MSKPPLWVQFDFLDGHLPVCYVLCLHILSKWPPVTATAVKSWCLLATSSRDTMEICHVEVDTLLRQSVCVCVFWCLHNILVSLQLQGRLSLQWLHLSTEAKTRWKSNRVLRSLPLGFNTMTRGRKGERIKSERWHWKRLLELRGCK